MKVYGPYLRKDNRMHVILVYKNGKKQTKSYPKFLMENHLGRKLKEHETVDHINNNFQDNRIENLQILSRSDNAKKEFLQIHRKRKLFKGICPACNIKFTKFLNYVLGNLKKQKSGPYCSRKCAGKGSYKNHWEKKALAGSIPASPTNHENIRTHCCFYIDDRMSFYWLSDRKTRVQKD